MALSKLVERGAFGAGHSVWQATGAADVASNFWPDPGDILLRYDTGNTYCCLQGGGLRLIGTGGATPPAGTVPTNGNWVGAVGATGYILCNWNNGGNSGAWAASADLVSLPNGFSYLPGAGTLLYAFTVPSAGDVTATDLQSPDTTKRGSTAWYTLAGILRFTTKFTYGFKGKVSMYMINSGPTHPIPDGVTDGVAVANLSSTLSTGAAITSLPVAALPAAIAAGKIATINAAVTSYQIWTTAGAAKGATSIPVTSATPNFAYPSGLGISLSFTPDANNWVQIPEDVTNNTSLTFSLMATSQPMILGLFLD